MARPGTLTVRVVSDTKPAEQGLDRFSKKVASTGERAEKAGRKLTVFATIPVAAAMGVATNAASELEQAIGGTEAVFGDASAAVDEFAQSSARSAGLSEREFRQATTSIGGQLKRMTGDVEFAAEQSVELTQVAADLAATYGGTTAEAVNALGAAFRGEADPAERFNLNLKVSAVQAKAVELGLAASTAEVSEQARAQATLALIMEQSADAQGQFAREAGTAAGSMQIARAEIEDAAAELGQSLAPILAKAAGGVADLASAFASLPDPVQNTVLALGAVLAAAGPVLTIGGKIAGSWSKVVSAFDAASIAAYNASGNLGTLAAKAGAVGAVIAVGVTLYRDYAETKAEAARITELYVDALKSENDELDRNVDLVTASELANKDYANAIRESGVGFDTLTDAVKSNGDAIESLDDDLPAVLNRFISLEEALDRAGLTGTEFGNALLTLQDNMSAGDFADLLNDLDGLSDRYDNATEKADNLAAAEEDVAGATDDHTGALDENTRALKDNAAAADELLDPIFNYQDALSDVADAQDGIRDANQAHADAQRDVARASDAVSEAQRDVAEAMSQVADEAEAARRGISDYADEQRGLTDPVFRFIDALEQQQDMLNAVDPAGEAAFGSDLEDPLDLFKGSADLEQAAIDLAGAVQSGETSLDAVLGELGQAVSRGLIPENLAKQVEKRIGEALKRANELEGANVAAAASAEVVNEKEEVAAERAEAVRDAQDRLRQVQEDLRDAQQRVAETADDISEAHLDAARKARDLNRVTEDLNDALDENPELWGDARREIDKWVERGDIAVETAEALRDALREAADASLKIQIPEAAADVINAAVNAAQGAIPAFGRNETSTPTEVNLTIHNGQDYDEEAIARTIAWQLSGPR